MPAQMSDQPMERLTEVANEMSKVLEAAENDDLFGIAFVTDHDNVGIVIHGYEDTRDAMMDLLSFLQSMFEAHGTQLTVLGVGENGVRVL